MEFEEDVEINVDFGKMKWRERFAIIWQIVRGVTITFEDTVWVYYEPDDFRYDYD